MRETQTERLLRAMHMYELRQRRLKTPFPYSLAEVGAKGMLNFMECAIEKVVCKAFSKPKPFK